jgi:hypothetical protein
MRSKKGLKIKVSNLSKFNYYDVQYKPLKNLCGSSANSAVERIFRGSYN